MPYRVSRPWMVGALGSVVGLCLLLPLVSAPRAVMQRCALPHAVAG